MSPKRTPFLSFKSCNNQDFVIKIRHCFAFYFTARSENVAARVLAICLLLDLSRALFINYFISRRRTEPCGTARKHHSEAPCYRPPAAPTSRSSLRTRIFRCRAERGWQRPACKRSARTGAGVGNQKRLSLTTTVGSTGLI